MKIWIGMILLFWPLTLCAAPTVTGMSGQLNSGQEILLSGAGFGAFGPEIVVFDDFEGGVSGEVLDLDAPVGGWDQHNSPYYLPRYDNRAHSGLFSGDLSAVANSGGTEKYTAGFRVNFPAATEYFLSYAVQVPPGTYFPQDNSSAPLGEFPNESVWKFAWIRDYENDPDNSPGDDDKCLPSHTSYGYLRTGGNDLNNSNGASSILIYHKTAGDTWWQWGSWNRFALWGRADTANPGTANGEEWVQGIGEGVEQVQRTDNRPLFHNGTPPHQWTLLHINGWIRGTVLSKPLNLLYDDIYFATGPGAAARVEFGDAQNYSDCTRLAISTPTLWSDTAITADFREGSFIAGDSVYLFVINADNTPSQGHGPLIVGETIAGPDPADDVDGSGGGGCFVELLQAHP